MRKIFCIDCDKYLGDIRDAKLLKGIAFLCPKCEKKRTKLSDGDSLFKTLFGGA